MAEKYPFKNGEDLKAAASQIDLSFDIKNIDSSLALAANDLKDVISEDVWNRMIDYYNGGSYNPAGTAIDDKLVNYILAPLANLALYHHFIWLQLRISNSGVTVVKTDTETAAFKYQTDEAKEKLLQTAWVEANNLITFLNTNEDNITEWKGSDQQQELKELIFTGYKDFDKYFSIDNNASFYIRLRYIILEIIAESISPRIKDPLNITDDVLLIKVKRYLAYESMSLSVFRFDILNLPVSIRRSITNSMTKKGDDMQYVKEKLSAQLHNQAETYLRQLDLYRDGLIEPAADESYYEDYEREFDSDDKFASIL